MRCVSLVLLLAMASSSLAFNLNHHKFRGKVCGGDWDRHFDITKDGLVVDPAPGQFAQKALNTVVVQTTAAAVAKGLLPKGAEVKDVDAIKACYDPIVPDSLMGKQYVGEYEFYYEVEYKVPGQKNLVEVHVVAKSFNRRHFPWFEVIEAYMY